VGAAAMATAAITVGGTFPPIPVAAEAADATALTQAPTRAAVNRPSLTTLVEQRIKELHTKLRITPDQEELWGNVTQIMRENAKTMDDLRQDRAAKLKEMSAVDDVKSYGEITEAHADAIKKFTPAFEALYNNMSDTQKKNADSVFRAVAERPHKMTSKVN
jgi:hypothetical protein